MKVLVNDSADHAPQPPGILFPHGKGRVAPLFAELRSTLGGVLAALKFTLNWGNMVGLLMSNFEGVHSQWTTSHLAIRYT